MDTKRLGSNISTLRKLRGFSQEELAEKLGISYQMVQKYENGKSQMTLDRLHQVAAALDVPVQELLEGEESHLLEQAATYGGTSDSLFLLTKEEQYFLKLFRKIPSGKAREGIIHMLKGLSEEESNRSNSLRDSSSREDHSEKESTDDNA